MEEVEIRRSIQWEPRNPAHWHNLAVFAWEQGDEEKARSALRRAVNFNSPYGWDYNALGVIACQRGQWKEAAELFQMARQHLQEGGIVTEGDAENIWRSQIFRLHYHPDWTSEELLTLLRQYEQRFLTPHYRQPKTYPNSPDPERRLKIGYLSADYRAHSMVYFLAPFLREHDHTKFELFAYAQLEKEDDTTAEYRTMFDHWCAIGDMDDQTLAERIEKDGIDILVDLSAHLSGSRIGVFAHRPAPISVSWWIASATTTGVSAIDYLLIDPISAPSGSDELFAEKLWRLDGNACTYAPKTMPEVTSSPYQKNGYVRFCSLTSFLRLNDAVLAAWSEILRRVPTARLIINSHGFRLRHIHRNMLERFAAQGIGPERLEIGYNPSPWEILQQTDITLDPFPYSTGTTLMEGMYMGHPVVTWANRIPTGRLGAAHVSYAGHPEWVAQSKEDYIDKAVQLASDPVALAEIRAGLRDCLRNSPMMDHAALARKMETAYRQMWRIWCREHP